jgi:hypothetical protein
MAVSIRIRRGTTAQWNASTNVLASGEIALDTTLGKIKVGNGSSLWQDLPFFSIAPSELLSLTQANIADTVLDGTGIDKSFNAETGKLTVSVDNTIASKTYVDTAVSSLGNTASETYLAVSLYGNPDGVATLDSDGTIPDSEIPETIARSLALSTAISTEVADRNTAITNAIAGLLDSAPEALNTLNELSAALADDPDFATTLTTTVGNKLDSSLAATTYAPIDDPVFTGTVAGVTKAHVGLGNVDNTSDAEKPISTLVQAALNTKINEIIEFNSQSGSYTIQDTDTGKLVEMSGGGTLTIPSDAVYNFPIGTSIEILQTGTSQVTIAGTGFTPNATPGLKLRTQWSSASLLKRGSNSWVVLGDLAV